MIDFDKLKFETIEPGRKSSEENFIRILKNGCISHSANLARTLDGRMVRYKYNLDCMALMIETCAYSDKGAMKFKKVRSLPAFKGKSDFVGARISMEHNGKAWFGAVEKG